MAMVFGGGMAADTVAVRFKTPKPFSVIRNNTVRLMPDLPDSVLAQIGEIRYSMNFQSIVDSLHTINKSLNTRYCGSSKNPPYDLVIDISGIPDQDGVLDMFGMELLDKTGRIIPTRSGEKQYLVVDRNPRLNPLTFSCAFQKQPPVIDGRMDDWARSDSMEFSNQDNRIVIRSAWNDQALFLAIQVYDSVIVRAPAGKGYLRQNRDLRLSPVNRDSIVALWLYDEIEIYFDIHHQRHEMRTLDDAHLMIGAGGGYFGRRFDISRDSSVLWGLSSRCTVTVDSAPSRYNIELALPWSEFGLNPRGGLTMGFDVLNKDRLSDLGSRTARSLCGLDNTNSNNPSEWGQIVLLQKPFKDRMTPARYALLLVIIVVLGGGVFFFIRRKSQVPVPEEKSRMEDIVQRIDTFIQKNYTNPKITAQEIAVAAGITPKYAGNLFKKVKDMSFVKYISQLRIAEAKRMLISSEMNITDIGYKLGYNSPEYFIKVFKSEVGMTPLEFRQKKNNLQ